jgi:hypothetical protein
LLLFYRVKVVKPGRVDGLEIVVLNRDLLSFGLLFFDE